MAFRRRPRQDPRVELTPMVDVVFLLLIFFMISTTFVETQGLTINLPKTSPSKVTRETNEIQVYLSREGDVFLQEEPLSLPELRARLNGYGVKAGQMMFVLMADREATHGAVVKLMDMAKQAGFEKLAIATERQSL